MTFDFSIANDADNSAIRALLARNPMPGRISVAFEREPDYFSGHGIMGERTLTLKAVERESGELAGVLCVAASSRFVDGEIRNVGYLGQIRVDSRYDGYLLPMRSIGYLRSIAMDWPDLWFCAIVDDNPVARTMFADRSRPSFPRLTPVSDIHTHGLFTRPARKRRSYGALRVRRADELGLERVVDFLREVGATRQFYPVYDTGDFIPGRNPGSPDRLPGLAASDILVVTRGGTIVGVGGVWDQSSVKQTVVHGYKGWLCTLRPVVNATSRVTGMKRLPAIGEKLPSAYLSMLGIRGDDGTVLRTLLEAALDLAYRKAMDYLLVGTSERDPLRLVVRSYRHILYRSTMYAFSFQQDSAEALFDPSIVPYLEIAAL